MSSSAFIYRLARDVPPAVRPRSATARLSRRKLAVAILLHGARLFRSWGALLVTAAVWRVEDGSVSRPILNTFVHLLVQDSA